MGSIKRLLEAKFKEDEAYCCEVKNKRKVEIASLPKTLIFLWEAGGWIFNKNEANLVEKKDAILPLSSEPMIPTKEAPFEIEENLDLEGNLYELRGVLFYEHNHFWVEVKDLCLRGSFHNGWFLHDGLKNNGYFAPIQGPSLGPKKFPIIKSLFYRRK